MDERHKVCLFLARFLFISLDLIGKNEQRSFLVKRIALCVFVGESIYFFSGLTVPIIAHAKRLPALPVFFDSSSPPRPKSSGFS